MFNPSTQPFSALNALSQSDIWVSCICHPNIVRIFIFYNGGGVRGPELYVKTYSIYDLDQFPYVKTLLQFLSPSLASGSSTISGSSETSCSARSPRSWLMGINPPLAFSIQRILIRSKRLYSQNFNMSVFSHFWPGGTAQSSYTPVVVDNQQRNSSLYPLPRK